MNAGARPAERTGGRAPAETGARRGSSRGKCSAKKKRPQVRAFLQRALSVSVHFLLQLASGLRLDGQGGRRTRQQARNANGFARFFTPAVAAVFDPSQRLINLLQQLALAVSRPELQRVLFLDRRLVGRVR